MQLLQIRNYLKDNDIVKKVGFIALLALTRDVLETCIDLLGFKEVEAM